MKPEGSLVSINNEKYKKHKGKILDATASGELRAFAKCPETGEVIRVHPDLIKRMQNGESFSIQEIKEKQWN